MEDKLLNEAANLAKLSAGFKEPGNYFEAGNMQPKMTFVEGQPALVQQKMQFGMVAQPTPTDAWNQRKQAK
jgi:hypothetical protein